MLPWVSLPQVSPSSPTTVRLANQCLLEKFPWVHDLKEDHTLHLEDYPIEQLYWKNQFTGHAFQVLGSGYSKQLQLAWMRRVEEIYNYS